MSRDIQNQQVRQPPAEPASGQSLDHQLIQADRLPRGGVRNAMIAEVLRLAQERGDADLEYRARLRLADAAARGGIVGDLIAQAEWCLERHLEDPVRFAACVAPYDLAEVLAAVPGALASSTRRRLSTIDQALDELCELLAEGDDGPIADLREARARFEVAEACGNVSELPRRRAHVERLLRRAGAGGGAGGGAEFAAGADAIATAGPAFSAERRIAESLMPLLENGQLSDAYLEHLRGCALMRERPRDLRALALHVEFCSTGGHLERGLLLVRQYVAELVSDPFDERSQLLLLLAFGGLLDLVCESVHSVAGVGVGASAGATVQTEWGDRMLGPNVPIAAAEHPELVAVLGELSAPATAESISDACWAAAQRIALAFDRRNGNSAFSDRVARAEVLSDQRVAALVTGGRAAGATSAATAQASASREAAGQRDAIRGPAGPTSANREAGHARVARADGDAGARRRVLDEAGRHDGHHAARSSAQWLRMARERASSEDTVGATEALSEGHAALAREIANATGAPPPAQRGGSAAGFGDAASAAASTAPLTATAATRTPATATSATATISATAATTTTTTPATTTTSTTATSAAATTTARTARTRAALHELEIRLAIERGDLERAEQLVASRIDQLYAADRIDLAEVETELGLLLFGLAPDRRRGDLERELDRTRDEQYDAEAQVSILNALGELRLREGRASEAVSYLLSSVALCGHDPDSTEVQRPLALLAHAQVAFGQAAWARATLDRLLRHDLDRATRANALLLRAGLVQQAGDARCALDDADRALSLYLELRYGKGVIDACVTLASLLEELRIRPGVIEAWRMAVAEAESSGDAGWGAGGGSAAGSAAGSALARHPELGALRFRLARALVDVERGAEAAAELLRAYDELPGERGDEAGRATRLEVLFSLGNAQRLADDDEAAVATWTLALAQAKAALDARGEVRVGLALARLQLEADDPECIAVLHRTLAAARQIPEAPSAAARPPAPLATMQTAPSAPTTASPTTVQPATAAPTTASPATAASRYDSPQERTAAEIDTLHLLGIAQCAFGDIAGLATLDRAIELAARSAFDIDALLAAVSESRARAYDDLGLESEALETAARAARLYERMLDRASAGQAHLFTARLLVTQGRFEEALPIYRRSLDMLPPDAPVADLAASEWHATAARVAALAAPTPRPAVTADPR